MVAVKAAGHIVNAVGEREWIRGFDSLLLIQSRTPALGCVTHIQGDSSLLSGNTLSDMAKAASAK